MTNRYEYMKKYQQEHKEAFKIANQKYRDKDRKKYNEHNNEYRKRKRKEAKENAELVIKYKEVLNKIKVYINTTTYKEVFKEDEKSIKEFWFIKDILKLLEEIE